MKLPSISFNHHSQELGKEGSEVTITKRSLLSILAKIFDALSLLSAFKVSCKLTLQKSWVQKVSWDEPLKGELLQEAKVFLSITSPFARNSANPLLSQDPKFQGC